MMALSFQQFALGLLGIVVAGAGVAAALVSYRGPQEYKVASVAAPQPTLLPPPAAAAIPPQPEPQPGLASRALDLDAIAAGAPVPRRLGWSAEETASAVPGGSRRQEFVERVLPLALLSNEEVLDKRMRLWEVRQRSSAGELIGEDRLWLAHVADIYGVQEGDWPELMRRIDAVPTSILVAAAAWATGWNAWNEAGWRSLFRSATSATQGRAAGSPPERNDWVVPGSPLEALRVYLRMLNTHPDFLHFRRARERLRRTSAPLQGPALTATLPRVSPGRLPGAVAVFDVISNQRLEQFDSASLAPR